MQKSKQTHLPRARIRQVRLQADGAEAEAAAESRTASGSRPMAGRGPTNGRQAPRSIWLPVLRGGCRKTERAGLPYKRRCRKRGSQSRGYTGTAGGTETTKRRQVGALQIRSGRTSRRLVPHNKGDGKPAQRQRSPAIGRDPVALSLLLRRQVCGFTLGTKHTLSPPVPHLLIDPSTPPSAPAPLL